MVQECIRNHTIFCFKTKSLWVLDDDKLLDEYQNVDHFLKCYERDKILKLLCDENKSYAELKETYDNACKNKTDTKDFIFAYKINNSHYLRMYDDKIYVYYFQDRVAIREELIFPWDYPQSISFIGNRNGYSDLEIIEDYTKLSVVDFFCKYFFCIELDKTKNHKKCENNHYMLYDSIDVVLDSHVAFYLPVDMEDCGLMDGYISDMWECNDERMIDELCNKSMMQFGQEYKAYWCS